MFSATTYRPSAVSRNSGKCWNGFVASKPSGGRPLIVSHFRSKKSAKRRNALRTSTPISCPSPVRELLLNAAPWIGGSRRTDDKYLAALINAIEHVEKGSTACYDLFFEFPAPTVEGMEAVASAYEKVGLRAVIAPMVADLTFYQSVPGLIEALPEDARSRASDLRMSSADASLAALRMIAKRWAYPADRLRLGIAPTIPQHCTREFMIGCRDIAREHGIVMQTHVSESRYL